MIDEEMTPEAGQLSREELFPDGWDKGQQPEAAPGPEAEARAEASGDLAEAQEDQEQGEAEDTTPEAALGRTSIGDFSKAAGITQEEFYRDLYRLEDGKEVSVSQAFDERKALKEANEALLQERTDLQAKVNAAATAPPPLGMPPDVQQMLANAQTYDQALLNTDWSKVDPTQAVTQRQDLMIASQQLKAQAQEKMQQHHAAMQTKLQAAVEEADRQTRAMITEWNDQGVMTREWKGISDMLAAEGFQDTDMRRYSPNERKFLRRAWKAMVKEQRAAQPPKKVRKVTGTTLGAGNRDTEQKKPDLKSAQKAIREAKTQQDRQRARLTTPLG